MEDRLQAAASERSASRFARLEVLLERAAHLRSAPMEQYPLVGLGDVQRVTDLGGRPSLDVAERHHLVLRWGEGSHRLTHDVDGFACLEALRGLVFPREG